MKREISFTRSTVIVMLAFLVAVCGLVGCKGNDAPEKSTEEYPADIAHAWIRMQQQLFAGTPGLLPHVTGRAYAYLGLTLYESSVPGMPGYQSIAPQLDGDLTLPGIDTGKEHFWPASANAAMASILRKLLPHAPAALLDQIDSLEAYYEQQFQSGTDTETWQRSSGFGKHVAEAIFEWSKSDGGHEAYKNPFSDSYVPPVGPGKWVSTGEFPFDQPVYPYWGNNRTFIPGLAEATQPGPPPEYSEEPGSVFYEAVNEIFTISQHLTREDSLTAMFWAYMPLDPEAAHQFEDVSHAANIATQAMINEDFSLQEAAVLYCKHAMAGNEAALSCVKTKFHYNLVRPITYIRNVLGHSEWRPVVQTPPFPEYTSAHAAISTAFAVVLEDSFGKNYAFTDHTFDETYGPRHFESFEAYAEEAAMSRLQAGIHYRFAMDEGVKQGKQVAAMVLALPFMK